MMITSHRAVSGKGRRERGEGRGEEELAQGMRAQSHQSADLPTPRSEASSMPV